MTPSKPEPRPQIDLRLFRCGMDEKQCLRRRETPGLHTSFTEAARCAAQNQPAKFRRFKQ